MSSWSGLLARLRVPESNRGLAGVVVVAGCLLATPGLILLSVTAEYGSQQDDVVVSGAAARAAGPTIPGYTDADARAAFEDTLAAQERDTRAAQERDDLAEEIRRQREREQQAEAARKAARDKLRSGLDTLRLLQSHVQKTTTPVLPATDEDEVRDLVRRWFPRGEWGNAMAVARCESGLDNVVGSRLSDGSRDWGVFGLNDRRQLPDAARLMGGGSSSAVRDSAQDIAWNVRAAARLHGESGWSGWICAYRLGIVATLFTDDPGPHDGDFDGRGLPASARTTQPDSSTPSSSESTSPTPGRTPSASPSPSAIITPSGAPEPSVTPSPSGSVRSTTSASPDPDPGS